MKYCSKKMHLIERYFNEDLSKAELEFFEQEMERDEKFRIEVTQYEYVFGGLKEARAKKLKSDLQKYEDKIHSRRPKHNFSVSSVMRHSAVAAVAIIVTVIAINFSNLEPDIKTEQVFSEYFRPYPNVIAPVTRSTEVSDSDLKHVMSFYDAKDYDAAIEGFDNLIMDVDLRNEILFYKGVALLANGKASEARNHFEMMDPLNDFSNQRKWYLSLALVQLGEINEAEQLLNEIIYDKSYFIIYAKDLLDILSPK
jgi:tetratricopeptide (TPR) repeat protein